MIVRCENYGHEVELRWTCPICGARMSMRPRRVGNIIWSRLPDGTVRAVLNRKHAPNHRPGGEE